MLEERAALLLAKNGHLLGLTIKRSKIFIEIVTGAIRTAQAEQRQRIIAIIKGGDRPWQELVDAILKQEE